MIKVKGELLKLKRIKGMHMIYIFPLLLSLIPVYEKLKVLSSNRNDILISPFSNAYFQLYSLFAPFVIILIVYVMIQIENKNNMWESNMMLPIRKIYLYISKIAVAGLMVFVFTVASYLTYVLAILLCNLIFSGRLSLTSQENYLLCTFFNKMLLSSLLYALIAVPLFIFIESSVISIGSFAFFFFISLFLTRKDWYEFYPFSYNVIAQRDFFQLDKSLFKDVAAGITSVYVIFSLVFGMTIFQKFK